MVRRAAEKVIGPYRFIGWIDRGGRFCEAGIAGESDIEDAVLEQDGIGHPLVPACRLRVPVVVGGERRGAQERARKGSVRERLRALTLDVVEQALLLP